MLLLFAGCWLLTDLVLQVDGAVATGSRVCVVKCALSSDEREKLASGKNDEELPMEEERYSRLKKT